LFLSLSVAKIIHYNVTLNTYHCQLLRCLYNHLHQINIFANTAFSGNDSTDGKAVDEVEKVVICKSPIDVLLCAALSITAHSGMTLTRTMFLAVDSPKSLPLDFLKNRMSHSSTSLVDKLRGGITAFCWIVSKFMSSGFGIFSL
jgi:hypothetical protein